MSYDTWLSTEPDDIDTSGPITYRCLDCAWTGKGGIKAWDHHQERHHQIAIKVTGDMAVFSCCAGGAIRRTA